MNKFTPVHSVEPKAETKVSRFKNSMGVRYLAALFLETTQGSRAACIYTLRDQDHEGYPSLRRLYIECEDLTEYTFAVQHLNSWDHWQMLLNCTWFQPYISRWRSELAAKLLSRHEAKLSVLAAGGGKEALAASRYLLERAEKVMGAKKVGRPHRDTQEYEKTNQQALEVETTDDHKRLNLGVH